MRNTPKSSEARNATVPRLLIAGKSLNPVKNGGVLLVSATTENLIPPAWAGAVDANVIAIIVRPKRQLRRGKKCVIFSSYLNSRAISRRKSPGVIWLRCNVIRPAAQDNGISQSVVHRHRERVMVR